MLKIGSHIYAAGRLKWLPAVAIIALASVVAAGAVASIGNTHKSRHHRKKVTGFSVLTRHRADAATSSSSVNSPPASARLAATSGDEEVYVWQEEEGHEPPSSMMLGEGPKICIMERLHSSGFAAVGCSLASELERKGSASINVPSKADPLLGVTAFVPDGVKDVTAMLRDGSSREVPVTNNIAVVNDPELASVSYELPDGHVETSDVSSALANSRQATPIGQG